MNQFVPNNCFKTVVAILFLLALLTQCISNNPQPVITNSAGEQFAGSASCKSCHADIYNSYQHTAHQLTSAPGEKKFIKGSFESGQNMVYYSPYDRVAMEDRDSGLYQTSYYKNEAKQSARMDMVIGSGTKGQTYLYWNNYSLFQLPVSYFTAANSWANSPGNNDAIVYNRPVFARCLECHATYAKQLNSNGSQFAKSQIVYGVTCESCHGAAAKHVQYQQAHPSVKDAKFIINPGKLNRLRQIDQCGLCHSGIQQNIQPVFTFIPGDTLAHFYKENEDSALVNDVHGSKVSLLEKSACFIKTNTLTCNTCHNTHQNQRGNMAMFSTKCMNCHTEANHNFCKMAPAIGEAIKTNCIDCHMPLQSSNVLSVYLPQEGKTVAATMRQHLIKVYPEETEKMMHYLKQHQQ